jgi:uncharacterized membrane protein YkoI
VRAEELEHEGVGGSTRFQIKPKGEKGKIVREVNVDADTGALINVETEKG